MQLTHTKRSRIRSQVSLGTRWRVELRENVSPKYDANGTVALRQRYLYRGYLQIASYDIRQADPTAPSYIIWDPTHSVATRPLVIRKDQTWYTYGWDLTKNICEVYGPNGNIRTIYTYTPYGTVTAEGDVTQPIQWSSEMHDTELGLVYYNYRYYNPTDGRWTRRDPKSMYYANLYTFINNDTTMYIDYLGGNPAIVVTIVVGIVTIASAYAIEVLTKDDCSEGDGKRVVDTVYQKCTRKCMHYSGGNSCKNKTVKADRRVVYICQKNIWGGKRRKFVEFLDNQPDPKPCGECCTELSITCSPTTDELRNKFD